MTSGEAQCARSGEALVQEHRLRRADDHWIWIRDEMTVVRGAHSFEAPLFYGVFLDVTDRKRMEAELKRLAPYHPLTGLPAERFRRPARPGDLAERARTPRARCVSRAR